MCSKGKAYQRYLKIPLIQARKIAKKIAKKIAGK